MPVLIVTVGVDLHDFGYAYVIILDFLKLVNGQLSWGSLCRRPRAGGGTGVKGGGGEGGEGRGGVRQRLAAHALAAFVQRFQGPVV